MLERADKELKQVGSGMSSKHISGELRSKQELSKALREATENMLRRLRDLGTNLASVAAPEKKSIVVKEVSNNCSYFSFCKSVLHSLHKYGLNV